MKNYRELFLKYLQNDLKGDELKSILQWLNNPANIHEFESMMEDDWSTFNSKNNNYTGINESFEVLKNKITSNRNTTLTISEKRRILRNQNRINPKIRNLILRIAAGILIPLTVGIVAYQAGKNSQPESSNVVFNEIAVPMGSKTQIELSDGTKIWLNSGSKLKYPQKFTGKSREVELEGEGYFDVVKNPKTPFIVKASDLNIKVLGTSFNVKAYPEEGSVETTLVKGTIQISKVSKSGKTENTISLKPKERATYIKEKGKLILSEVEKKVETVPIQVEEAPKRKEHILFMKDVDTEQFTAWKDNKLVFKNEDLESLCIKLERWYNVKINLKSKDLRKFHYTGTIENETINDVIKIIQLTMPIDYEIDHSTIDIWSKQQCN